MDNLEIGAILSRDGTLIAIDWNPSSPTPQRTILPVLAVPTMIDMLINVAAQAAPTKQKPQIQSVLQPTNIQLRPAEAGNLQRLRITLGELVLEFALSAEQAGALGMTGPQPQQPKRRLS